MGNTTQFPLDMDAEVQQRSRPEPSSDAATSMEMAAKINEMLRQSGVDEERSPIFAEKLQRDLQYQHQIETLPQPESAPLPAAMTTPEVDRIEQLQKERDAAMEEARRWKKEFGRREGKVGGMEARIKELESRVQSIPPTIDVRAMTGKDPNEPLTAQEIVNLMMSQSTAFGNTIRQVREELAARAAESTEPGLPLDMEAELVEAHPWLTDLPRPQKMRAMQDILASAGVTVAPPQPGQSQAPLKTPSSLPPGAVRQAPYIEPSNKGSVAEKTAVVPERQALNEKLSKLNDLLKGPYKEGASIKAAEILASLGAGPADDSVQGFFTNRRRQ